MKNRQFRPPCHTQSPYPVLALMCLLSLQATIQIVLEKSILLLLDKIPCLAFLVAIALLWAGLLTILALSLVVPFLVIHDLFVTRFRGHGRRLQRWEYTALTLYFGFISVVIWLGPDWLPMLGCVVLPVVILGCLFLPRTLKLTLL